MIFCKLDDAVQELGLAGTRESRDAIHHQVFRPSARRHHRRDSRSERLQDDVTERIGVRWECKNIHVGVRTGQILAVQQSRQFHVRHILLQPAALMSVSDHRDSKPGNRRLRSGRWLRRAERGRFFQATAGPRSRPSERRLRGRVFLARTRPYRHRAASGTPVFPCAVEACSPARRSAPVAHGPADNI